jgi:high-affinity Fe2+/Pb2+ permease
MGTEIHWLAVLVAAVAGFLVGGLWYGPLFGKAWQAARGLSDEALKDGANMPLIFGLTFLLNVVSAFVLDHTLGTYGDPDMSLSLMIAGGIALGFVIPAMGVNYLFSRMSLKLFLIDAGYWLVIYCLMGAILDLLS